MSDAFSFTSVTPRLALPNLFSGQAQKEITVNEALARIDALMHLHVLGVANDPPSSPVEGNCWIVDSQPTGAWASHAGQIAFFQSGNWFFAQPVERMVAYDASAAQQIIFDASWQAATDVTLVTGGATQDAEARAAIAGILDALRAAGILPAV